MPLQTSETNRIGLRTRMLLLVLLAAAPLAVLLMLQNTRLYREKESSIFDRAKSIALQVAAYPQRVVPDPAVYLANLSRIPEMRQPQDCAALMKVFGPALKAAPYFVTLAVFKPDGDRICPVQEKNDRVNVRDREYFQTVLRDTNYSISNLLVGRLSKKQSIIFAQPVLDQWGDLRYVLNLGLDAAWLSKYLNEATDRLQLPANAVALAIDDAGTIIAASPSSYARIGTQIKDWSELRPLLRESQTFVRNEVWADGIPRATAYVSVFDSLNGGVRIRVGIPAEPALKAVREENLRRILFTLAVVLVALSAAWLTSEQLVLRPLRRIWQAATALKKGDFTVRVADVHDSGELGELALAFNNMMDQIQQDRQRLSELATRDPLTGLANRYSIRKQLVRSIKTATASGSATGVILLDLDGFKEINDSLGHPVGDKVLVRVARVLDEATAGRATAGRLGGDEFVILVDQAPGEDRFAELGRHVRERLRQPIVLDGQQFFVSASMGIAVFPQHGEEADALLQNADVAMYRAKAEKLHGHLFYSPAMNERASARLRLQNLLSQAVANDELRLYYQPKICAITGKVAGAEALIRWHSRELGFMPPGEFIELAEQTGLIVEIGEWVFRTACLQLQRWRSDVADGFHIAVNLSPRQFADPDLVAKISQALAQTGVAANCIELEITEGALMHNPANAIEALMQLRALGLKVSVDDFGTGYSSLGYLKRLPIDALKIDRAFVAGLPGDSRDRTIISAVIAIATELGLRVTAEGVETPEQMDALLALGCTELQGYLFGRPVPADEFLAALDRIEPLVAGRGCAMDVLRVRTKRS